MVPEKGKRLRRLIPLGIFLAAWAVYLNSLDGEFVFDDTSIIQSNPQIRSLSLTSLGHIFGSHYWQTVAGQGGLYRPIVILSYAVNYAVGGLNPWGYHFFNVLIHALNSVLVFFIIRELFGDQGFALWSGLLFALHPIRTEGVAYVVGRAESLAAFFFLVAWLRYLRGNVALSALAFFASVLTKESGLTFLAIVPLTDYVARWRPAITRYAAFAVAAVAALGLRYGVLGGFAPLYINLTSNPLVGVGTLARLLTATQVLGNYLWLLVFPVPLSADYSFNQIPPVTRLWDPSVLVTAALVLGGTALAWRRGRPWFFCAAFFLATFSLTSNFLRPIGTIMAERLLYLPSLGFTCAIAYAISKARSRELAIAAGVLLAFFYAGRTLLRNPDWHDHLALFSSAAVVSPNSSLVQANLAGSLLRKDPAAAAEHAREAIRIEPGDPAAHMTLGEAYQRMGDMARAAEAYAIVERLAPGTAGAQEAARRRAGISRR
ncbi:MAG: DUF1736 domain-containing protein [Acidobacteria bacterium]|nr:DUF1736 domain-containing protein [Acidobacteriota bacterium]